MTKNIKIQIGILVVLTIGFASYLFFFKNKGNTNEAKILNVGVVPIAVALPLYVANDEGYFKEEGFNAQLTKMGSSNELANALTSGQLDVAVIATNAMLDASYVSKKKPQLIITNPYSNSEGNITDYLLVKDTIKIKKIQDLKGKKIGVFPGSVIKVFCNLIFAKYGLNKDDYQLIELAPKDWAVALQTNQIDALSALEPNASQLMTDKIAFPIVKGLYAVLMPDVPLSGHWISEKFIKSNNKEKTEAIVRAIDKAVKFINENPEKAKSYLVKYANVREDVVGKVQLNKWRTHSEQNTDLIQQFVNILFENNAIQSKEDISTYLNK
jgi:ABC-type nitrate/sulfonate/bicarbonate transport system substrate-binding protein